MQSVSEITIARLRRGLQQRDLARHLGITYQHLSRVERRKGRPSDELKAQIAGFLDGCESDFFDAETGFAI